MKTVTKSGGAKMKLSNKVMLITYPDSLGRNLKELQEVMDKYYSRVIGGIHILPFFPSAADRGFSPITYEKVESKFGNWKNIESLSTEYYLMFDMMINHISSLSNEFQDLLQNGSNSKYEDMFIDWNNFWPQAHPTQQDIDLIYKRKNRAPTEEFILKNGDKKKLWNTFGRDQIDLNIQSSMVRTFLKHVLDIFTKHGAKIVRLDAFAYAVKKYRTSDFFVEPEIIELLKWIDNEAKQRNLLILPEIHEHYRYSRKISQLGFYTYDFALPALMLYTIYSKNADPLMNWLKKCPMSQFTTLDTHDGIGIVDAKELLTDKQLDYTVNRLYKNGSNVKRKYSSEEYNNLDVYQINTTFFSALSENDNKYLLTRAIQVFAPGIPQIYYVGLLAGKNDLKLLEKTKEGRNINRHYYSKQEIDTENDRPVVKKLKNLLVFRNECKAFDLDGSIEIRRRTSSIFSIVRRNKDENKVAILQVNLNDDEFEIYEDGKHVSLLLERKI